MLQIEKIVAIILCAGVVIYRLLPLYWRLRALKAKTSDNVPQPSEIQTLFSEPERQTRHTSEIQTLFSSEDS